MLLSNLGSDTGVRMGSESEIRPSQTAVQTQVADLWVIRTDISICVLYFKSNCLPPRFTVQHDISIIIYACELRTSMCVLYTFVVQVGTTLDEL